MLNCRGFGYFHIINGLWRRQWRWNEWFGITGAAGATGGAGAAGTVGNLVDLLGTTGGVHLDLTGLGAEGIDVRALTPNEVAGLTAAGITGFENIEVIDRAAGDNRY